MGGDGGNWIAAVLTAQGGKRGNLGKERGGDWEHKGERGGHREKGGAMIVGFMLYGGLIWGMWGA